MLENRDEIDDVGRAFRRFLVGRWEFFPATLHFLVDELHERGPIIVRVTLRVPILGHLVHQRLRHAEFALARFFRRRKLDRRRRDQLIGKTHQFQHEEIAVGFDRRQVLAGSDDHFGDASFVRVRQNLAQQVVGAGPTLLRLEIIRPIKIHRIDLGQLDEINDVDRIGRFEVDALKVLVLQDDELPLLILVALHDLFPRNFFSIHLGDALVIDRAKILGAEQAEFQLLGATGILQRDRNAHEAEADGSFPNGAHVDERLLLAR